MLTTPHTFHKKHKTCFNPLRILISCIHKDKRFCLVVIETQIVCYYKPCKLFHSHVPNHFSYRDSGYGGGNCSSGLGIFNFLLFLVILLGLLNSLLQNAMLNIMVNGQNISIFQVVLLALCIFLISILS